MSSIDVNALRRKARRVFDGIDEEQRRPRDVVAARRDDAAMLARDERAREQLDALEDLFGEIKHPKQRAFLAAYVKLAGAIVMAARAAKISYEITWVWRNRDPVFAAAFQRAQEMSIEVMESEAARRAFHGTEKGVWHDGERVGEEIVYSDNLAMFMLKGARPGKYRDQNVRQEIVGEGGGPVTFKLVFETPKVVDASYELIDEG